MAEVGDVMRFNSKRFCCYKSNPPKMLSFADFVEKFDYPLDKWYVDRFCRNILSNDWITVDIETLKYLGWNKGIHEFFSMMENNYFIQDQDFKFDPSNYLIDTDTLHVRARQFNELVMMMDHTEQVDAICKNYAKLKSIIIRDYYRYKFVVDYYTEGDF